MQGFSGKVTVTQKAADHAGEEDFTPIEGFKGLFVRQTDNGAEIAVVSMGGTTLLTIA